MSPVAWCRRRLANDARARFEPLPYEHEKGEVERKRERERGRKKKKGGEKETRTGPRNRGIPRDTKIGINEIDTTLSYSTCERLVEILVPPLVTPLCARARARFARRKALRRATLSTWGRPTRYAPAVDRRVARFNNDLQEPVRWKVTLRKR